MKTKNLNPSIGLESLEGVFSCFPPGKATVSPGEENASTVNLAPPTTLKSDTQGSPSETLNTPLVNTIKREWRQELIAKFRKGGKKEYRSDFDLTTKEERIEIEAIVRRILYG